MFDYLDYLVAQEKMKDAYREAEKARLIKLSMRSRRIQIPELFSTLAYRLGLIKTSKGNKSTRYYNIA